MKKQVAKPAIAGACENSETGVCVVYLSKTRMKGWLLFSSFGYCCTLFICYVHGCVVWKYDIKFQVRQLEMWKSLLHMWNY